MVKQQFRAFYKRYMIHDIERLIEFYSVFGGLDWTIDIDDTIENQIQLHILSNFDTLYDQITALTTQEKNYAKLLSALARGDRRIFSAFRKSDLSNIYGGISLKHLQENSILHVEYSREPAPKKNHINDTPKPEASKHRPSHKMRFTTPFLRFWFYFIAPHYHQIKAGQYAQVLKNFTEHQHTFDSFVFEELSNALLQMKFASHQLIDSGSYWDRTVEIDLMAHTLDDELIVGECKWTNHKINKKELHKLEDKCKKLSITPKWICFFSKRGFSKELHSLESPFLRLYACEDFEDMLQNISDESFHEGFNLFN